MGTPLNYLFYGEEAAQRAQARTQAEAEPEPDRPAGPVRKRKHT